MKESLFLCLSFICVYVFKLAELIVWDPSTCSVRLAVYKGYLSVVHDSVGESQSLVAIPDSV